MLCLHRDQHPVSSHKRSHRKDTQRWHTVDQAVIVFVLERLQSLRHNALVRHYIDHPNFHIRQSNVRRNKIHLFFMVHHHLRCRFV